MEYLTSNIKSKVSANTTLNSSYNHGQCHHSALSQNRKMANRMPARELHASWNACNKIPHKTWISPLYIPPRVDRRDSFFHLEARDREYRWFKATKSARAWLIINYRKTMQRIWKWIPDNFRQKNDLEYGIDKEIVSLLT